MSYQSMEEAKLRGEKENIPFWKAIQLEDAQERDVKIEDSWEKMKYMWQSCWMRWMPMNRTRYQEVVWSEQKAGLWTITVRMKNRCVGILSQR